MKKIKTITIGIMLALIVFFAAFFFSGRQFQPFITLNNSILSDVPFESFSNELVETYDVVMKDDNSGFFRQVLKSGSNNNSFITNIIYFEIRIQSKYINEPLFAYGGNIGIYITRSYSYVTYDSYNYWESRYKPFLVSYEAFLDNYSINPEDQYFTVFNAKPNYTAISDIEINLTLTNMDAQNIGDADYDPITDYGYYISTVYVHAVEKPEQIDNTIPRFTPENITNFIHTMNHGDPDYYINNNIDFPRFIGINLDAPIPVLALKAAYYEIDFTTQALNSSEQNQMQIVIDISFYSGVLEQDTFIEKTYFEYQIVVN